MWEKGNGRLGGGWKLVKKPKVLTLNMDTRIVSVFGKGFRFMHSFSSENMFALTCDFFFPSFCSCSAASLSDGWVMFWNQAYCVGGIIISMCFVPVAAASAKVVCFFTNWSRYRTGWGKFLPQNIDPFLCTHLVYAFAVIDHTFEIAEYESTEKSLYKSFTALKKR